MATRRSTLILPSSPTIGKTKINIPELVIGGGPLKDHQKHLAELLVENLPAKGLLAGSNITCSNLNRLNDLDRFDNLFQNSEPCNIPLVQRRSRYTSQETA